MKRPTFGFIGLGLIGGSIARALRASLPDAKIIAFDINKDSLALVLKEGIADICTDAIDLHFSECDYIFLCAPVQKNNENLLSVKSILKPGAILTDVGSVKNTIHAAIAEVGLEDAFIGGHPMAGSERVGFVNSKASLLENAYYILTPSPSVPAKKLEQFRHLVEGCGAIPLILDYQKHDYVTAAISHLPHVIAASLVNLVRDSDSADGIMKMVAAGGFKDITRIASSSAVMWQQICLTNTENISSLLEDYIQSLTNFKEQLDSHNGDALYSQFENSRVYRDSFINASSGPIKSAHSINVDIPDKSGSLAHITTLLAIHSLNIKNIGISHNRESEDGVLRLEFYEESAKQKAADLLNTVGFHVNIPG